MLTLDDRRTREVLITTHTAFQDPGQWTRSHYVRLSRGSIAELWSVNKPKQQYCLVGKIAALLGLTIDKKVRVTDDENGRLYRSIYAWLTRRLGGAYAAPEHFNDVTDRESVLVFLEECITEIEAEIHKDFAPPIELNLPKFSLREAVLTALTLGLF